VLILSLEIQFYCLKNLLLCFLSLFSTTSTSPKIASSHFFPPQAHHQKLIDAMPILFSDECSNFSGKATKAVDATDSSATSETSVKAAFSSSEDVESCDRDEVHSDADEEEWVPSSSPPLRALPLLPLAPTMPEKNFKQTHASIQPACQQYSQIRRN
jgi:hypothetical protein